MKYKNYVSILVIFILVLSLFASIIGIFSTGEGRMHTIISLYGQKIILYGKGIYKNDSVSVATQGIAQDMVTVILGIPLLIVSLIFYRKKSLRGHLFLCGTLAYFLYTYTSYTFLWMYNSLFLIYVSLMSISFFAFVLTIITVDMKNLPKYFSEKFPVKCFGIFYIFLGVLISFLWLQRILQPLITNTIPISLEQYTTLPIQALDLAFVVPLSIIAGIFIIKQKSLGYLLSSIITIKGVTMFTSITAMIVSEIISGIKLSIIEILVFPLFNLAIIYLAFSLMKNINIKIGGSI
ncbi:hypothetical protein KYB31_14445 [Clostridium felsineum]|uniref:hypothetical protein n=1 Tax=Clostridium felsineum TaxID=36839 RepID=UPI0009D496F9|nr:hypothetical protein [Clostridium felsineum]MCR3760175.1 hypothetical protein [Clostridium felsineum]URZ01575.1 hypothetical protein CLAUR_015700 [Clostridium felsineum]